MFNTHKWVLRAAERAIDAVNPDFDWDEEFPLEHVNMHNSDHFVDGTISPEADALINALDNFYREKLQRDPLWF